MCVCVAWDAWTPTIRTNDLESSFRSSWIFFVYAFYLALARLLVYSCIFTVILFIHFSLMAVFFCVFSSTHIIKVFLLPIRLGPLLHYYLFCVLRLFIFFQPCTPFLRCTFRSYRLFVLLIYSWKKHISLDANTRQNNIAWYIISLLTQLFGIHQVEPINYYKSVCVCARFFFLFHFIA